MVLSLQSATIKIYKCCPTEERREGRGGEGRGGEELDIPGYITCTSTALPPNSSVVGKKNKFPPCKQSSSL